MSNKLKTIYQTKPWVIILAVAFISLLIGAAMATPTPTVKTDTVTKTVEVEKKVEVTPASCRAAIEQDDKIFSHIADAFGEFSNNIFDTTPIDKMTEYIESVTPARLASVEQCLSK